MSGATTSAPITGCFGRSQRRRANAEGARGADLVVHQRDQRRDDERRARPRYRRHLVAKRLARASRHDRKRVLARHDAAYHLRLNAAEILKAEGVAENGMGILHHTRLTSFARIAKARLAASDSKSHTRVTPVASERLSSAR